MKWLRSKVKITIGVLRVECRGSYRKIQESIKKILGVVVEMKYIIEEIKLAAKKAREINDYIRGFIKILVSVIDETWVKVKGAINRGWGYGLANIIPNSLFIWSFDYLSNRDKENVDEKMRNNKKKGLNPLIFVSDILNVFGIVLKRKFKNSKHQLSKIHILKEIGKKLKGIPDKNVEEYLKGVKKRIKNLYRKKNWVDMKRGLERIIKEMSSSQANKKYIKPLLNFLKKHQDRFFIYKKYSQLNPNIKIPCTTNAVECWFSIYKPGYKVSKHYESEEGAQDSFDLIMLWHNLRKFKEGKRAGKSSLEIEGYKSITTDWTELIWEKYKDAPLWKIIKPTKRVEKATQKVYTNYAISHN